MVDQARQIEPGDRHRDVRVGVEPTIAGAAHVPAVVDDHVVELQRGCVLDVTSDRRGVHAGVRHVRRQAAGPPVPGALAWPDPGGVCNRAWRIQQLDEVRLGQPQQRVGHHDHAPGRLVVPVRGRRTVQFHGDAGLVELRRELRLDPRFTVASPLQVEAGIVAQVGLGNRKGRLPVARNAGQGQVQQVVRPDQSRVDGVEFALVAGAEAPEVQRMAARIIRQCEGRELVADAKRDFVGGDAISERDAIVIGTQHELHPACLLVAQQQSQLVVAFARL